VLHHAKEILVPFAFEVVIGLSQLAGGRVLEAVLGH
jgi:hypothetical protein